MVSILRTIWRLGAGAFMKSCGIIIDPGCSADCPFCGAPKFFPAAKINEQEKGIAKDLLSYRKQGIEKIEVSGSDPIEYPKLVQMIQYIQKLGFKEIMLNTHGMHLESKKLASDLIEAGVNSFRIPLYGSLPEIHDSVTGSEGSFARTIQGIKNIKQINPNIKLMLHTLVLKHNKDDILNIVKMIESLHANHISISVACVANDDYSFYVPYNNLQSILKETYSYVKQEKLNLKFNDIPYCIFREYTDLTFMTIPPNLGEHSQPREDLKTEIKNLPQYRLKMKPEICDGCILNKKCAGFYVNDIKKYGTGNLKPIKNG